MFRRGNRPVRNRRRAASSAVLQLAQFNWRGWMPTALLLLGATTLFLGLRYALDQPVQRVAISGRFQRVQALDVEKAVRREVGRQGLVGVDLAAVSRAAQSIAWVDRASVARSWPRGLHVHVIEQMPIARWGAAGLLNERGEVFVNDARHMPAELPELNGPAGFEAEMTARYLAAQSKLGEAGMRLTALRLDARGAWELALDNGVVLRLGNLRVDERFGRFMSAAVRIVAARATEIAYVDMRYANGFAIGWRSGAGAGVKSG